MALTLVENSASITASEHSLPNNSTTLTPQTDDALVQLLLDLSALTYGDEFWLRIYEKVISTGTQRLLVPPIPLIGPQSNPIYVAPAFILGHGWDYTLQRQSATSRTIGWSLRKLTHGLTIVDMSQDVDGTEWSIPNDAAYSSGSPETDDALVQCFADFATMAAGDRYQLRGYEKVNGTGDTQRVFLERLLEGKQTKPVVTPLVTVANGWDFTLDRLAGSTARTIEASVRKAAVA